MTRTALLFLLLAVTASTAVSADVTAFVGAHVIPVDGPEIDEGVVLVEDGRIKAVGPTSDIDVPGNATVVECAGKVIMPGLVCTHSHIGGWGGGDKSDPIAPEARILDAINVRDSGFMRARAGGLTSLNIMPGSGLLLSGQTLYVKLRESETVEGMAYLDDDGAMLGGIKMANGTNSRGKPPYPGTRSQSAALVRQRYIQAQEYLEKIDRADGDASKLPSRDLGLEALGRALRGEVIVHHHTHRHDDIMTVLRLREEFGLRVVLHHVSEGWRVADLIAAAEVPCSLIIVDSPGGKLEAVNLAFDTGAILADAGVDIAYHTDDWITDSRYFLRMAAMGVRGGLSREKALESVTLAGARMLDLEERIGSLTRGKDADLVVLSGDPFSVYTRVEQTWIEGTRVFDLDDPDQRLYAEGGFGATHDQDVYLCCQGGHQ